MYFDFTHGQFLKNTQNKQKKKTAIERMNLTKKDQRIKWGEHSNTKLAIILNVIYFLFFVLLIWLGCDKVYPAIHNRIPAGAPAGARSYWKHWITYKTCWTISVKFFGYCFFLLAVPINRKQPVKIASFWTKKILKYYIKSDFNFPDAVCNKQAFLYNSTEFLFTWSNAGKI